MRILAIDPGSSLGWATNATGRLEWGTEDFHIKRGESSGNRWRRFGEWLEISSLNLTQEERMRAEPINDLRKVGLIVYERATFRTPNRAYSDVMGGFYAIMERHAEELGIALQPVPVQTLKAFAIPKVKRKKGDPKMDRGKVAMIAAAFTRLHGEGVHSVGTFGKLVAEMMNKQHRTIDGLSEHEADALWLYWWALENCQGGRIDQQGSTARR